MDVWASIDRAGAALRARTSPLRRRLALALSPGLAPSPEPEAPPRDSAPASRDEPVAEPVAAYPKPSLTRHAFLRGLHERLVPRSYLEIGVNLGRSLAVASCFSVGVDPGYRIDAGVTCPMRLFRMTSDDYFASHDPRDLYGGMPIDFSFIDGLHLAEFAYRDFANVERVCGPASVVVIDDMLPRSVDEAARDRHTGPWTGDVYKVGELLRRLRPDLVVMDVNTEPTGVVVVVGLDPASSVLREAYDEQLAYLLEPDPQQVPSRILHREAAVDPVELLESPLWPRLVELRETTSDREGVRSAILQALPTLQPLVGSDAPQDQ